MDWWLITFFLGALLSLFLTTVPTIFCVVLSLVFASALFCWPKTRKYTGFLLGGAWLLYHGAIYQEAKFSFTPTKVNSASAALIVKGKISTIPRLSNNTQRFNFDISHVNDEKLEGEQSVRLAWKSSAHQQVNYLVQGQQWQFKVRLKPAHGLANSGGFSYQSWLRKNHLVATGYVLNDKGNVKTTSIPVSLPKTNFVQKSKQAKTLFTNNANVNNNILLENSISLRHLLYQKITALMPAHELSPIALALMFGERSQLNKSHWHVLKNTATQHLIAISGLHLGLVAGGGYLLFSWLITILPLSLLLPGKLKQQALLSNHQVIVISLTLILVLFYSYLAGFSVPTSRALIMLLFYWAAKAIGIKFSVTRLILLTIFFIILFTPFSLFSSSFWLSLYAVCTIFVLLWRFRRVFSKQQVTEKSWLNKSKQWLTALFYLQIGLIFLMMPITVQFSHQLSLLALPANLVAVPWMSITSIPLSLLAVVFAPVSEVIARFFIDASLLSLSLLWQYLTWLSDFSVATITVSVIQWCYLIALTCFIFFFFILDMNKGIALLFCSVFVILGLTSFAKQDVQDASWQVNVMDVGQGLSIIIETNLAKKNTLFIHDQNRADIVKQNQVMVYDTGASFPSGFSMAEAVIEPYLISQGYQRIDKLVISHDDNDHAGGLSLLTDKFKVAELYYNKDSYSADNNNIINDSQDKAQLKYQKKYQNKYQKKAALKKPKFNIKSAHCLAGNTLIWQHLTIEFLWPNTPQASDNDDSCVIKISDGKTSVLLTGDISQKIEQTLIDEYVLKERENQTILKADILIVPHHGSKTSSSNTFIQQVSPMYAVFSAGYLNRWKMPVAEVVERYHQHDITTFNTAELGMIQFIITPENIEVKTQRQDLWPFWFAN
ncbi:DNA internalization-related competence protein ComEC/Rec2 [Colwellia sp. 1_MG-2023]|uniref:DNA internalization-related competence protein ComEC/Rec2 n=1 Tax=Colwellia sp. 1_MG-2023 TaxID=3062649 RepID=UPI0026E1BAC9|nr:DNA internalization-related competence protein ComEC/Rec2 [Colwellia sp. 1_MG-2023]MDO6447064.1 DNA internalization-related competence protein ComEC/Rec2 [Colwellia sp. 1_MG-2023]